MSVASLPFFIFFAVSLAVYYLLPGRFRWCGLLVFSLVFFFLSALAYTAVYLAVSVAVTTLCAGAIARARRSGSAGRAKLALAAGIAVNAGILAVLKYSGFFIQNINRAAAAFGAAWALPIPSLASPMGISFYTMSLLGCLLDVYWDICPAQTDPLKMALFTCYYPQLTSGPITRYNEMRETLYSVHRFDSRQVAFGLQRMLWGVFKKLVISARAAVLVDTVYGSPELYGGFYVWVASALFTLQLYTDFSGCMDIVLGASECYGVKLPENFRTPLFSRSVQEFWQRWHITLGSWLKDYILYPILRSRLWRAMTKGIKSRWGKRAARQIPSLLGMLCVWLLIGLWHGGGWKYILGMGLWFWLMIGASQVLEPVFKRLTALLRINTECFSWHLFQSLRMFALVCVGNIFFRLDGMGAALRTIRSGLRPTNPEIFFNGALCTLGLDRQNLLLLAAGLALLLLVSALQEKGSVRERIERQNIVFRWAVWFGLIFGVLIFGIYGQEYDAAHFIYGGF